MTNLRAAIWAFLVVLIEAGALVSAVPIVCAQATAASSNAKSYKIQIPGSKQWVDTNINLQGGSKLRFTATGQITYPADTSRAGKTHTQGTFGPDGLPRGFADLIHDYPVAGAGHGALIGRLGSEDYAQPLLIGASKEYDVPVAGRLFLGINQNQQDAESATGSFSVTVEVLSEGTGDAASVGGPVEAAVAGITPDLLSKLPRRVSDQAQNPGDMVNVLIVGTQDQVVQAFTSAGWVQVDKDVGNTVVNALLDS